MHRFFITPDDCITENRIEILNSETLSHMVKVLRLKIGESVELVADSVYLSSVTSIDKDQVVLEIESIQPLENESSIKIDLFQCLPKGPKLEYIIQKNVELGVRDFYLVESDRCVATWKSKDEDKKLDRYQKIAKEAAKQSKRDYMPQVHGVLSVADVVKRCAHYDAVYVLYENEENRSLKEALKTFNGQSIAIVVGPEGGFETIEIEKLMTSSSIVSLGKRILRTETAGLVAVTCSQYELGGMD